MLFQEDYFLKDIYHFDDRYTFPRLNVSLIIVGVMKTPELTNSITFC